jgi:uncharacterized BrkB/YihY/UPF0761 family membrane protein
MRLSKEVWIIDRRTVNKLWPDGSALEEIEVSAVSTHAAGYDQTVQASPFDKVAYLFALLGLYVMVGGLFFYGFWNKAIDGDFKIAPPLEEQFDKTIIGTIPGADVSWVLIIILEGLVFLLVVASLATTEFRPSKRKPFLLTALAMALLVFGLLSFGQNATAQHESVASLYGYFGATVILMLFVRTLPPYTSNRWLG